MPNVHVRGLQIKMKNKTLQFLLMYRHNNFKRFYQLLFRTAGLQHKLLILIVSPNIHISLEISPKK